MSVHHMENDSEFKKLLEDNPKVVIDFSATWCGPCKRISPIFEKYSEEFTGVKFVKIDVDECAGTAQSCDVSAMPTFQFYENGKKVGELLGAAPDKLKELIEKHGGPADK